MTYSPKIGCWNTDIEGGFGADYQIEELADGVPMMPMFRIHEPATNQQWSDYEAAYRPLLEEAHTYHLPICLRTNQPEGSLIPTHPETLMEVDGQILNRLTSAGNPTSWKTMGEDWAGQDIIQQMQAIYPDPPVVYWLSNNEAPQARGTEQQTCQKFIDLFGTHDEISAQSVAHHAWPMLYQNMFAGIRSSIGAWSQNLEFIGYSNQATIYEDVWNQIPPKDAWLDGVYEYAWEPKVWSGGGPVFYRTSNNDSSRPTYLKGGPTNLMSEVPYQDWTKTANLYWQNWASVWQGPPDEEFGAGHLFTPARYQGWCRLLMFLMLPEVLIHFEKYGTKRTDNNAQQYFDAAAEAVLDFKKGLPAKAAKWKLMESELPAPLPWKKHTDIQGPLAGREPFYQLEVDVNPPPADWNRYGETELLVWAVARRARQRAVVYAWSPVEDIACNVTIDDVTFPVLATREGSYTRSPRL